MRESQHLIVYSDSDPEQAIQLVNNLERLDYVLRMYLKPFLVRQTDPPSLPTPDNGRKLLQRVQATAASARAVDFAQVTLSRAQIEWGDPRDAIPSLADAVRRDPGNVELHSASNSGSATLASVPANRTPALPSVKILRNKLAEANLFNRQSNNATYRFSASPL